MTLVKKNVLMFSVYEKQKEFHLNGTETNMWPEYKSQELIRGRKCYEFYWNGGDCSFVTGFKRENISLYFFCVFHKPKLAFRLNGVDTDYYFEGKDVNVNEKYMICIDTIDRKFLLINETDTKTIKYNSSISEFIHFIHQGSELHKDVATEIFDKNLFKYKMPLSYLPVTDRRLFEYQTCKYKLQRKSMLLNYMLMITIINK